MIGISGSINQWMISVDITAGMSRIMRIKITSKRLANHRRAYLELSNFEEVFSPELINPTFRAKEKLLRQTELESFK